MEKGHYETLAVYITRIKNHTASTKISTIPCSIHRNIDKNHTWQAQPKPNLIFASLWGLQCVKAYDNL